MKPTTYSELRAQGDTTTMLTPIYFDDLQEFVAQQKGHGHSVLRKDGRLSRCGGAALCKLCKMEEAIIEAMKEFG